MDEIKRKTVYTGGTFDLFHAGHVKFLKQCSKLGSVIVALNTDDFIEMYKGAPPIMSYKERETMMMACIYVDYVIPNAHGADSKPTIELIDPDYVAIGSDWAKKDYYSQMGFTQEWLDQQDISLVYLPYTENISSTIIKERLNAKSRIRNK